MSTSDPPRLAEPRTAVRTQYAWTIVEQAITSLTNFAAASLTARSVGVSEFGEFGLLFASYLVVVGIARAGTSDPLAVRQARLSDEERTRATSSAATLCVLVGTGSGVVVVTIGVIVSGRLTVAVAMLAAALPLLVLQDFTRQMMIIGGRARSAVLNGAVWLGLTVGGLLVVGTANISVALAIGVWAVGGCVAAVIGLLQTGITLGARVAAWLRTQADLSARYAGEFLLSLSSGHLLVVLVAWFAGLSSAGGVRGAQVVIGPLAVVFGAISTQAIPHLARSWDRQSVLDRHVRRLSIAFVAIAAVTFSAILALPESLGRELLGASWAGTRVLLPWFAVTWLAIGVAGGAVIGLRATGQARRSLRARVATTLLTTALILIGLVVGDAREAIVGLALGNVASIVIWWHAWRAGRWSIA